MRAPVVVYAVGSRAQRSRGRSLRSPRGPAPCQVRVHKGKPPAGASSSGMPPSPAAVHPGRADAEPGPLSRSFRRGVLHLDKGPEPASTAVRVDGDGTPRGTPNAAITRTPHHDRTGH